MSFPSPQGSKNRWRLGRKAQLVREIQTLWNKAVPETAASSIPWMVLSASVESLSDVLKPPFTEKMRDAIKSKSVRALMKVGADEGLPQSQEDHASYFARISVLNLFKKFPWTDGDLDPANKARERFHEAEKLCVATNRRFRRHRTTDFAFQRLSKTLDVHQVFHLARRKIASWLGECEPSKIFTHVKHGPGGCVGLSRPYTTPYHKFSEGVYTVTTGAYFHALRFVLKNEAWCRALWEETYGSNADNVFDSIWPGYELEKAFIGPLSLAELTSRSLRRQRLLEETLRAVDNRMEIADYNKVTFVPKDATTLRAIAIEPRMNVLLQLAVGRHLKGCLSRAGCDLTSQLRNQELAYIGSVQQDAYDPVTIDLRMASDCLAIEVVRELLPCEWFELLDSLRSRNGMLDGERISWEKFSSMGNGFTFELESMVFYALAQSVSDLNGTTEWFTSTFGSAYRYAYVSVFGDDIIVPSNVSEQLIDILRFCGFQTNRDKTFTSGPFRESCGKDYYSGVLVRPFYMKRSISQFKDLIHLRNNLKGLVYDGLYQLDFVVGLVDSLIPESLLRELVGPRKTTGDDYVWSDPDACHRSRFVVWDTDYQNWLFPIMRQGAVKEERSVKLRYSYLQFLYSNAGGDHCMDTSSNAFTSNDAFLAHVASGGSAGDVVLSGTASPGLMAWVSSV